MDRYPLGTAIAGAFSVLLRGLGYFLFGALMIIYRRDVPMMLLFGGIAIVIGLLAWWIF